MKKEEIKKKFKLNNKFLMFLIIISIALWGLFYLDDNNYIKINNDALDVIGFIYLIIIVFLFVNIFLRFTLKKVFFMFENELEIEQRIFLTKLYSFIVYLIGITIIIHQLGFTTTNITTILSFISIGIAFAIRDIILSFFAWLIILSKKPFRIGDYIKINEELGVVDRIGTFFITLKTNNNENFVKIPNKIFLDKNFNSFNKNKIPITSKITITQIPKDFEKRKSKIINEIRKIVENDEEITALIEIKSDSVNVNNINIVLNYYTSFKNVDEVKNKIYLKFYELNEDIIMIKKVDK
jgi:MscS family membrane protein